MRIGPEVVDVHDRRTWNVQRSRESSDRQERDKAATRHSYEADVVGGNDFRGPQGELPDPKGGVGDG